MPAVKKNSHIHKDIMKQLKDAGLYEKIIHSREPLFPKKVALAKERLRKFK